MEKIWKPNTTINIPVDLLDRAKTFVSNHFKEIKSRNILIEKALTYYMDNYEEIKKADKQAA